MAEMNDNNGVDPKIEEVRRLIRGQLGLNKSREAIINYLQEKGYPQYLIEQEIGDLRKENTGKTRKSGVIFFIIGIVMCLVGVSTRGIQTGDTEYYFYGLLLVGIPFLIMGIYKIIKKT
ncbi:MAG: hypothetical protein JXJ04_06095 [Spirochaetales bacterium]|nr:hypothetical protein [Spirochaetales bacterium]